MGVILLLVAIIISIFYKDINDSNMLFTILMTYGVFLILLAFISNHRNMEVDIRDVEDE